ncbi:MAG: 16S rRNA (adenine(1518)-N(6)/adenine(1519)-N(6))-dimethyltransferase RsmA [Clostridia bacterium]
MSLNELLSGYGFKFNKKFGQNFISDKNLLEAIVKDSKISNDDIVIEIGAGAGTLTAQLCAQAKKVIAFEIDANLKPILSETLSGYTNYEIIYEDALKCTKERIQLLTNDCQFKVVANLPYYITTPIIMKFIEEEYKAQSLTVMVQYEVAKRLTAEANTVDYGAITVAIDFVSDAVITRKVNRQMFYPAPNVDSAVVYIPINRNKYFGKYKETQRLVKAGFNMRRKTLVNNLIASYAINRSDAEALVIKNGLDKNIRAEAMTTQQFYDLAKDLSGY